MAIPIPVPVPRPSDPSELANGHDRGHGSETSTDNENEAGPSRPRSQYILTQSLSAHTKGVTALRFSNDGKTLVSAGADGWLHFWNPENGERIRGFRCHRTGINDISISPDSLYIATASDDSTSQIHSLYPLPPSSSSSSSSSSPSPPAPSFSPSPTPLRTLSAHTAPVLSIAFSPKSNLLVSGSFDESAIIWNVRRGKVLRSLPAHADAIWCVGWDGEGGMVITSGADGLIRLWDASSGQCLKTLDNDTNSPVSFASFTPSSSFLLSATLSSTLRLYNIHTSKVLKTLRAPGNYTNERWPCPAIVFRAPASSPSWSSPRQAQRNGTQAAADMDVDVDVDMLDDASAAASRPDGVAKQHKNKKENEAWIVSGSENGKIIIWDLDSKRVVQVLEGEGAQGHQSPVVAIAVHKDGIIASGSLEGEKMIKLWRTS